MVIPNLLLIAGTGTKAGKTTLACKIIRQVSESGIVGIKITPHFHETTPGLILINEDKGYSVYEETNRGAVKDTSRMVDAGAEKVFFAKVWDNELEQVFLEIMKLVPDGAPILCESPALRNFIEPGLFIIMTSETVNKQKKLSHLQGLPHLMFRLEDLDGIDTLPIRFEGGKWLNIS